MVTFDEVVAARRSVRGFLPTPVPRDVIVEALSLAQRSPSNCNVQPWRVFLASGAARDRVRNELLRAVMEGVPPDSDAPAIETFPGDYRRLQVECAAALYGKMGVERGDHAGRARASLRNFELFDAPHVAIVGMEKHFGLGVALDVGMWVQTFMLTLSSRGIGSCAQAALRTYPGVLRRVLGIREDLLILCGISFGYEDVAVAANATRQTREPIDHNVVLIDDPLG